MKVKIEYECKLCPFVSISIVTICEHLQKEHQIGDQNILCLHNVYKPHYDRITTKIPEVPSQ